MRPSVVTETDVALLRAIGEERGVVAASRRIGLSRDRAVYRLHRLARAFGGPVVAAVRGGPLHGATRLTPLGDRIARGGFEALELLGARPLAAAPRPNRFEGTFHVEPVPRVELRGGPVLRVAFRAEEGERVSLLLDPESIIIARQRFPSSARNVLAARVESVGRSRPEGPRLLTARVGAALWRIAVTDEPVRELHLAPGARVWLYVKAAALRRVAGAGPAPTRGSRRP